MASLLFRFSLAYSSISLWCSVISTSMKVTDSLPSCKRHSYRWGLQESHRCLNIFRIFRLTLHIPKKMSIFFLKCSIVYSFLKFWFAQFPLLFFSSSIWIDWWWLDASRHILDQHCVWGWVYTCSLCNLIIKCCTCYKLLPS